MKRYGVRRGVFVFLIAAFAGILVAHTQENAGTVPVHMTVTASAMGNGPVPDVKRSDVVVRQRRNHLQVTGWEAARGNRAGLDLFIAIDDAADRSLGSQLNDIRAFINAQPPTTNVGVGYMRNATIQIVQNFTPDHAAAANSVRLPLGSVGSFGSPFLSAISLMNGWPAHPNRRVLIMITDGIDRARGGPRSPALSTNPDVNSASTVAQRTGTIIYGIYTPGVGHLGRNFWEATRGQNGIAQLSEASGGESFFLGLQAPVSFRPYLESIQRSLDNQYLLEFRVAPNRRAGLQSVTVETELPGVELISADSAWVPAQ
ncbi:MAG TPA: hypothetical protein VHT28_04760 [Silvibacterium sp.]|nr:hypothetical protein [Silvibacterium sp.]